MSYIHTNRHKYRTGYLQALQTHTRNKQVRTKKDPAGLAKRGKWGAGKGEETAPSGGIPIGSYRVLQDSTRTQRGNRKQ